MANIFSTIDPESLDVDVPPIEQMPMGGLPPAPVPGLEAPMDMGAIPVPPSAGPKPYPESSGPTDADKLAAAQVILGTQQAPDNPAQPVMIQETSEDNTTTSNSSTSTTTKERSPETIQAEREAQIAADAQKAAIGEEAKAAEAEGLAKADLDEANNDAIVQVETAKIQARQESLAEIQNKITQRDNLAAELANAKPETFWGSKDASDRVSSALSIGLGSFGQAMLGSGQNIGQVLLERQMDEFSRNQDRKYQARVKQIDSMSTSISEKRALLGETDLVFDANKVAALAQIQGRLGRAQTMAKTASVKAGIAQRVAGVDQKMAELKMNQASKYEQTVVANEGENVVKRLSKSNKALDVRENVEQAKQFDKGLTDLSAVRSEIATGLKQLKNPNISREEKLQIAAGMMKAVNKSKESIGAEEAERLGAELRTSTSSIGKAAAGGATAGAGLGGIAGAVPTLGFGAPVGAGIGAALGGVGAGAVAAFDELGKPGGIRLSPDVEAFTRRLEGTLQNVDGTLGRQSRIQELVKRGLTIPQANAILDRENQ